jgi:uncharacterized protein RhaS with RHS repeats
LYYLNSRYYNPEIGRFINADGLIGQTGDILGHNMYAYCQNNPVMMVDSSGYWPDWNKLVSRSLLIATGVIAVAAAATVLTGGAATPLLITAVAYTTAAAGAATVAYGLSEIGESVTDYNVIRDGLMDGNKDLYNTTKSIVSTTANVGTMIIGAYGITKALQNAGKIPTKIKLSQIQNNPLDEFVTIGPKAGRIGEYTQSISRTGV